MDHLQNRLIGALIGLARATDGNEHLITDESTSVILDSLAAKPSCEDDLLRLLERIDTVKRKMVPDCYLCANPCGRTAAFDLSQLEKEESDVRNAKYGILTKLAAYSGKTLEPRETLSLYHGLVAIGLEGLSAPELSQIL